MITNEERREAAGKLLDTTTELRASFFSCQWEANLEDVLGVPVKLTSEDRDCLMAALDRLEDLIEPGAERTGHAVEDVSIGGYVSWRCSECEQPINKADNYCSNCGVSLVTATTE